MYHPHLISRPPLRTIHSSHNSSKRALRESSTDIRALPNPPKNVRAQQTGLHKSLREWFFSRPEAVTKLEDDCTAVNAAVADVSEQRAYPARIHVVVFCEMGKHRSVALAEELSRRAFFVDGEDGPEKCQIVLQHRDVARVKHGRKKQRVDHADL